MLPDTESSIGRRRRSAVLLATVVLPTAVYRKLGVANRTQASHYAHVHRLLDSPTADQPVAVGENAAA